MAQQEINVGASPNDGTGDFVRDAFIKTNDNFTELYASGGSSPFVPMSMMAQGDNEFACFASVIVRPTGAVSNGAPITWEKLTNADNHGSSFIRSAIGQSGSGLRYGYPQVKSVLSLVTGVDELFAKNGCITGPSAGVSYADMRVYRPTASGVTMRGNGTTWTFTTSPSGFSPLSLYAAPTSGKVDFNFATGYNNVSIESMGMTYVGTNNYRIERIFSALFGNAGIGFYLVDIATNTRVTTPPTSADVVTITSPNILNLEVNMAIWGNPNASQNTNLFMSATGFNFWCIGLFELYMKVLTVSDTELLAKWQSKSGVTSYTLKRSTAYTVDVNGNYILTTPTTVYTGTALEFADTALTPDTMYYYQLLDQTATEITQFNTKTKA